MRSRRRPLTEQQRRDALVKEGDLLALTKHPGWPALEAFVERERQAMNQRALWQVYGRSEINRDELLTMRGFMAGMNYVLATANGSETRLERILQDHGVKTEEEAS